MSEIEKIAQGADFIVNGYSFFCQDSMVRVLNLNNPACARFSAETAMFWKPVWTTLN